MNIIAVPIKRFMFSGVSAIWLCGLSAGLAQAADPVGRFGVQAQYEQDVANCAHGNADQDKAACLREAKAARAAALQQPIQEEDARQYRQNALDRCHRLPVNARTTCIEAMEAPSKVSGSVSGGGVLRETVIPVPARP